MLPYCTTQNANWYKALSEREYQILVKAVQEALVTADPSDAIGLQQRLEELQFYWRDLQERPIV